MAQRNPVYLNANGASNEIASASGDTLDPLLIPATPVVDAGTVSTGTVTLNHAQGDAKKITVGGAITIALSNWPASGNFAQYVLEVVNGGSAAITWPTMNWVTSTGAVQSTPTRTLQTSGVDWIVIWSCDGGETVYARFI
jgi:hypothetical protein